MRIHELEFVFVELMPDGIEFGRLYISMKFATAIHLCCCGCGHEVVTPFSPTDWRLSFDGDTVSLHPSIGNWGFPCQSHYWIKRNRVIAAPRWEETRIAAARVGDLAAKADYFDERASSQEPNVASPEPTSWWRRAWAWVRGGQEQ